MGLLRVQVKEVDSMSTPTGPAGGGDADGTHQPPGWPDFLQAAWNET